MNNADLIIKNIMIVTVDGNRRVIDDGAVAIKDNRFIAVDSSETVFRTYESNKVIDGKGKALFPGFINLHGHLFQNLLKGLGRDKKLFDWLDASVRKAIHEIGYEDVLAAATAGAMENLNSGVTTILDYMYCHGKETGLDDAVIEGFKASGIRGVLGRAHTKVGNMPEGSECPIDETEDMFFADVDRLMVETKDEEKISLALAPGIIWDLSEEGYKKCRVYADKYNIPITMHILETVDDDEFSQSTYGKNTMAFLESTGVLGPDFIGVHCVDMSDEDFEIMKKHKVPVAHCPISNMVLGSGFAPIPRMKAEGMVVGLATDGAASNDSQNFLEVIKATALVHKANTKNPKVMPAEMVLEMATIDGAKALGMDKEIGSIEVGKKADCFIFSPKTLTSSPAADPIANLVYASDPMSIETVIVSGDIIKEDNKFSNNDVEAVLENIQEKAFDLRQRVGLSEVKWNQKIEIK